MSELKFIQEVLEKSGVKLLLDINNVYVNSFNHKTNAKEFLQGFLADQVIQIHMAGHKQESEDLIIDTH